MEEKYKSAEEQDSFLTKNFMGKDNEWLSDNMPISEPGRKVSIQAVMRRMKKLGLSRIEGEHPPHHHWTEDEIEVLELGIYSGQPFSKLAAKIGVPQSTVIRKPSFSV